MVCIHIVVRRNKDHSVPTPDAVAEFIRKSTSPLSKREIARALRVGAAGRRELNTILDALERDGVIARAQRRYSCDAALPEVTVLEVMALDFDGEPLMQPVSWRGDGPPPRI